MKDEIIAISADQMTVAELKTLCKENNLDIKGLSTKAEILKVVRKWEKKLIKEAEKREKETLSAPAPVVVKEEVVFASEKDYKENHDGRKVVSRKNITLNGKEYTDVTVKGGITYRLPNF